MDFGLNLGINTQTLSNLAQIMEFLSSNEENQSSEKNEK